MSDETVTPESTDQPTTPETSQGTQNEGTSTTDLFTQADVDRIVGDRAKRASESAINKFLESLGLSSVDEVKATIEAERKRKEADMSEAEKLQAELEKIKAERDAERLRASELEKARLDDMRDNGLLQLLTKAHDPQKVLTLLKSEKNEDMTKLLVDGVFDSAKAEKLVADYTSANAYLFKSGSPGSPSNNNGRVPQPNLDEAQNEVIRKFGRL